MKIKIGNVSIDSKQAARHCRDGKYLVTYSKIYQLNPANKVYGEVHGTCIYNKQGLVKRGTHAFMTGKEVNELLGFKLLREE